MSNPTEKPSETTNSAEGTEQRDSRFTARQRHEDALLEAIRRAHASTY